MFLTGGLAITKCFQMVGQKSAVASGLLNVVFADRVGIDIFFMLILLGWAE